ncbi:MAG: inositol monophosphatase [Chloroflexi bacterium]|nr:inositol monophosphatase [Chloroflexota bacterium]
MATAPGRVQLPDEPLLSALEDRAAAWADEVGRMLLGRYGTLLHVEYKVPGERSPVTAADRDAEAMLRAAITREFPSHSILGEEGEDLALHDEAFLWVLDPLDGTTNFINGLPLFGVSIGVLYEGMPVAAAIFAATSHRGGPGVYAARRGGGARFAGEPLRLPLQAAPQPSRLAAQPAHFVRWGGVRREFRRHQGEVRTLGSVALELAYVASGTLQYAIFGGPRIWDVAAGVLLVQEAGGLVVERQPGSTTWMPLHRFTPPPQRQPGDAVAGLAGLRRWRSSLVAGSPQVAGFVAEHLPASPPSPWTRLVRSVARWVQGRRARRS